MHGPCVKIFAIASLFALSSAFPACEAPQDSSGEVGALLGVLVASGVVLLPGSRDQCDGAESGNEDGCNNQNGD